jgi:EmrB/QacA subfamily drug resistance transporter
MNYRRAIDAVQHRLWPRSTAGAKIEPIAGWDLRAVLIGVMVPMGMTVLNLTMFGVALPAIRDSFKLEADTVAWLVTSYTLPFVMFMPLYGRLGDGLGKRRLFSIGIILFFIGTMLCLITESLELLILGRVIQGIGTAGVNPLCIAVIAELFPDRERGRALATWSSTGPATGMIAPFMGGILVDHFGWQSMFWTGILASVVALWVVRRYVPRLAPKPQPGFLRNFDWLGLALLSGAIVMLVAYLSSRSLTGVEPLQDWRLALATVVLGLGFWAWERRHAHPLVPLNLFAVPNFSRTSLAAGLRMILMSSEGFLIPLYLTDIYGVSSTQIGMLITLQAGALLAAVRLGGPLADRWSRRLPVMIGFTIQALIMIYFANLPVTLPLWGPALGIAIHGGAAGLSLAVLHRLAMDDVPVSHSGAAAGLYSMMRFFGSIIGATIGGVILRQALDYYASPLDAYHLAFWCWAAVAMLAVVVIWPVREAKARAVAT